MMIFSTPGIVLRSVKFGETSAVVTIYTREFGLQSYMVNGIRSRSGASKEHLYQPASLLEMQVYHNPLKNLQRIKEAEWKLIYRNIFTDVSRNTAALLMVEWMLKSIRVEEQYYKLFDFAEEMLMKLDALPTTTAANVPLFFVLKLPTLLGFQIKNDYSENRPWFDFREGTFTVAPEGKQDTDIQPVHAILSSLLKMKLPGEAENLPLNGTIRKKILVIMEQYFKWHIDGFKELNTLRMIL